MGGFYNFYIHLFVGPACLLSGRIMKRWNHDEPGSQLHASDALYSHRRRTAFKGRSRQNPALRAEIIFAACAARGHWYSWFPLKSRAPGKMRAAKYIQNLINVLGPMALLTRSPSITGKYIINQYENQDRPFDWRCYLPQWRLYNQ